MGRGNQHHHDGDMPEGHDVAPQTEDEKEEEQEKRDQEAIQTLKAHGEMDALATGIGGT